jgi:excisionase family DNA binding protein
LPNATRLGPILLDLAKSALGAKWMAEPWLSVDDIATHLGVSKDTVYSWIAEKDMPAHRVGRLWKFQTSDVDEWVRSGGAASSGERAGSD